MIIYFIKEQQGVKEGYLLKKGDEVLSGFIIIQKLKIMNEGDSQKLLQHLSQLSQRQSSGFKLPKNEKDRMNCEPSQSIEDSQLELQAEIQQFKREIEERFIQSISNKLYTFPKKIINLSDFISSDEDIQCQNIEEKDRYQQKMATKQSDGKATFKRMQQVKKTRHFVNSHSHSAKKDRVYRNEIQLKKNKEKQQRRVSKDKKNASKMLSKEKREHSKTKYQKKHNKKCEKMKTQPQFHNIFQMIKDKTRKI